MSDSPPGFELYVDQADGFPGRFGPVWRDLAQQKMGFRVTEDHMNHVGSCHGGAIAAFADYQIAAVRSGPGVGTEHLPTVSLTVDYLAPTRIGAWVEMDVTLVKATRTLVFTQALITADKAIVARSAAIYRNRFHEPTAHSGREHRDADAGR
jgi:uncharacterized protein (TIGR00369 family)